MKIKLNDNFKNVSESYLFSTINKKVSEYKKINKDAPIIRMGIGDVTLPLPKIVIDAMHNAVSEMGVIDTFKGYPPEWGYRAHCLRAGPYSSGAPPRASLSRLSSARGASHAR